MALGNYLGAFTQGTAATTANTNSALSQYNALAQQQMYNPYALNAYDINTSSVQYVYDCALRSIGQGIAAAPEKIVKKAKGLLAELREEIDAWHGNILRV
jgi:hypothetical protein